MCNKPHRLRQLLGRLVAVLRDRRGVSAIEFGITVPIIVLIVSATYDIGNLVQQRMKLSEAVYAGAQYAVAFPSSTTGINAAITASLPSAWSDVTISPLTITCACWSAGSETTASCSADPVCPTGQVVQRTVALQISRPYTPLVMKTLTSINASYVARIQ